MLKFIIMFQLFKMGGPLFMGILTGVLFIILVLAIVHLLIIVRKDFKNLDETRKRLKYLRSFGLLAFVIGILGQMIGLFSAFTAIEQAMDVSPAIMAGGLKVSMITPMYGMVIFVISYIFWLVIDYIASRQAN